MTDEELYQLYIDEENSPIEDNTIIVYDTPQRFFDLLNYCSVDTENYWYYFVNIT